MRPKYKRAIAIPIFFLVLVPALFWLSGFDFDQRGQTAIGCALLTLIPAIFGAVMAATFPD